MVRNGQGATRGADRGRARWKSGAAGERSAVDGEGARQRFTSEILPPLHAALAEGQEVLPLLYLHGLSTGDFREALPALLGEEAAGLSPTTITRLTRVGRPSIRLPPPEPGRGTTCILGRRHPLRVRLEDERLCTLVLIGARPDGTKEFIAVEDGYRESAESWATVLRDSSAGACARRWSRSATARWASGRRSRDVWPETRTALLGAPPRQRPRQAAQAPAAAGQEALHEIMDAETRGGRAGSRASPRSTARSIRRPSRRCSRDQARLLTFFDFPAEHWKHLRTTNIIESPFATVRLRKRVTKGAGSRTKALMMAFKLLAMAGSAGEARRPELLPLGARGRAFVDGVRQEKVKRGLRNR